MSEHTQTRRRPGAGKPLLWLALALTVALLSFVTYITARHNPYLSDRDANGISKWLFIEACKEQVADTEKLAVGSQGQSIPLAQLVSQSRPLAAGERLETRLEAPSTQIVRAAETVDAGGWSMTGLPVTISVLTRSGERRTLGQLPLACTHDVRASRTTATLQLPGQ